ncbi:MAG TPA: hypothetical protein VHJ18_08845 [Streptosporangiaceae bacterium]|jgi:hypothetical protein|nr:hypothetical protein [Streptosporangiaceae bacterium]
MRRRTFDALMVAAGLALAAVLLVAGGLLTWGHTFVSNEVHTQLAAQKIVFPPAASDSVKSLPKADAAAMRVYAGQEMTTGAQAQTYSEHFIAVHLSEIGGGLTYSQLSAKAMADPTNTKLADQVATVFKGTTLRGMLLNAYAFWQMGQIALFGAIAAFAGAALMLILSLAGAWHLRRTPETVEVFNKGAHPTPQTV